MKNKIKLFLFLLIVIKITNAQDYFQQEVDYKIKAYLDVNNKILHANIIIKYINNSPDSLEYIYFHLWTNAYKNNNSAFAIQQEKLIQTDFLYANSNKRGYIDSLNFIVNGIPAKFVYDEKNPDIGILYLNNKLNSGETIIIETDFFLKIPFLFSRLGYTDNFFALTQWYPKPAVYDKYGWHPMPYLDIGEFYSEFGDYDVEITLPDNYVVAATGNLLTKSELQRMEDYSVKCKKINKDFQLNFGDSTKFKTLRFSEKNIHDFALFASPNFLINIEPYKIESTGQTVFCQTFFFKESADLWENATDYIYKTIELMSKEVGSYPYKRCSAVENPENNGGGMEYPTITIVNSYNKASLEKVIVHEVIHNWFYGMLASNERDFPWIDEGFTSFYEYLYSKNYLKENKFLYSLLGIPSNNKKHSLNNLPERYTNELFWLYVKNQNSRQSIRMKSEQLSPINYFVLSYYAPPSVFLALRTYIGDSSFVEVMRNLYNNYAFKHLYPNDIIKTFEEKNIDKNTSVFFEEYLMSNKIPDFSLKKFNDTSILVKNKNNSSLPLFLYSNDSLKIINNFAIDTIIPILSSNSKNIRIDKYYLMPETRRENNYINKAPIAFKFFNLINNPMIREICLMPLLNYNTYDKLMPGIVFYSPLVPRNKIEYFLAPTIKISKNLALRGSAGINYYLKIPKTFIKEIEFFSGIRSFGILDDTSRYIRTNLGINFKFSLPIDDLVESGLVIRHIFTTSTFENAINNYGQIQYYYNDNSILNPLAFNSTIDIGKSFVKSSIELQKTFSYKKKNSGFEIRFFAGKFIYSANYYYGNYNFRLAGNLGFQDYFYDNLFISRTADIRFEPENFWAHQFVKNEGGFAIYTPYGQTDDWLTAINLSSTLPLNFLKVYFSLGFCPSITNNKFADMFYEGGISLNLLRNIICIYFPLLASNEIISTSNNFYTNNYFQKIRFTLSLEKLNLKKYRDNLFLFF